MDTLIVGFSRPKKWKPFAWLIMKAYGTPYDHVYIKIRNNYYERDSIYQASNLTVSSMNPIIFLENNEVIREFILNVSNKKQLVQFMMDNSGKAYSKKEVLGFSIQVIASWFGIKITNPFKQGNKEYVCSILAAYICSEFANIKLPESFDEINPKELYELLESI